MSEGHLWDNPPWRLANQGCRHGMIPSLGNIPSVKYSIWSHGFPHVYPLQIESPLWFWFICGLFKLGSECVLICQKSKSFRLAMLAILGHKSPFLRKITSSSHHLFPGSSTSSAIWIRLDPAKTGYLSLLFFLCGLAMDTGHRDRKKDRIG